MDCVAKSLKKAAEELKVPIIVLSQLQRGPDRPQMDDISDSKELKELADVIILMHNRIGWDKIDGQIIGEFIIAKLLQKSEMRKNMVMDLIYRGFINAANYSESHYNPRRSQIKTELRYLFVTTPNR